jgi:phage baseplate assembly protein W
MADIYYYDISKKGIDLLGTGDIPILTNEQAVKESILNLLLTELGSKVMDVTYGLNLDQYLFAPLDDFTAEMMQYDIEQGILNTEERITDLGVIVTPTEDDLSTYTITINFSVVFSNTTQTLQVAFNKIR